jgi:hypothetical protein
MGFFASFSRPASAIIKAGKKRDSRLAIFTAKEPCGVRARSE